MVKSPIHFPIMIRRQSTRSKSEIQRHKSTTSVRSVTLEHISAATAERDATIAAIQAFSRGQDRHSADTDSKFPPQRASPYHKENLGSITRLSRNNSAASEHERNSLGRKQSVRFVGPDSGLQTRASRISMRTIAPEREDSASARRSVKRSQSSQNFATRPPLSLHDTKNIQLPDRVSSRGKTQVPPKPAVKQNYLQDLMPEHQHYTPEDDVASMPSSFRRLRKTRSMFTPRNFLRNSQDSPLFTTETVPAASPATLRPRFSFLNRKENEPTPSNSTLRAPKSMSFLRQRKDRVSTSTADQDPNYDSSPITTGLPAEHSFRSRILPRPSMFFGAKGNKLSPNMRKTLRSSASNAVLPASETATSISTSNHGSLRVKARKISSSIKSRFRNLFINNSEDDDRFPAQQIEAQRSHVANLFDVNHFGPAASEIGPTHVHENSSLARVSSRLPVLHAVPSCERLRSRSGSIDSFKSEDRRVSDEKSRVTSWASTEANTIVAHRPLEDLELWDRQRLSVITENGFHAPSPSLPRPKFGLQTITSQEELATQTISERLVPGVAVDSQRVYSALMKRMTDTQQLLDNVRKCSDASDPFRTLSPPTSDDSSDNGEAVVSQAPPQAVGNDDVCPSLSDHVPERNPARLSSSLKGAKSACSSSSGQIRPMSPPIHLTPKGVAKPLTDRSSAFFGSPTSHLFRTRSPWRKSLQAAMNADRVPSQEPFIEHSELLSPATDVADKKTDSASNYSQDTQIHTMGMKQGHPPVDLSESAKQSYDTTNGVVSNSYHPTGERRISTTSSVDWKACLSHDTARAEHSPISPTRVSGRPCEVEYVVPTMPRAFGGQGHVREAAQIGSYAEDEYNASPAVRMPTNPTTPLGSIEPNIKLTPQQCSVIQTTPPSGSAPQEDVPAPRRTSISPGEDDMVFVVPKDALRPRASPLSSCGDSRSNSFQTPAREASHPVRQAKSLAHIQNIARIRVEETGSPRRGSPTVRLMRKSTAKLEGGASPATSTPGFSTAFSRHFGSLPKRLGEAKENQDPTRAEGGGKFGDNDDGQQSTQLRGSKTMVDLFLNSRRRQRRSGEGASFV